MGLVLTSGFRDLQSTMFSFAKKLVDRLEGGTHGPQSDSYFKSNLNINNNGHGLRILHVVPNSQAHKLGFEAWFDYIVGINNHDLPMMYPTLSKYSYNVGDDGSLNYGDVNTEQASTLNHDFLAQELSTIAKSPHSTVTFDVWNAKGGVMRQVYVQMAPFVGEEEENDGLLKLFQNCFLRIGLLVQSQHLNTATYAWKILNTYPDSPAFRAQLIPYSDYIIGCDSAFPTDQNGKGLLAMGGEALLSRTVLSYYNHHNATLQDDNIPVILYVYNHDYDVVRPVTVHLSRAWAPGANRGILGCDVGYGLLHRIPEVLGKFNSTYALVDDVLFENKNEYAYNIPQKLEKLSKNATEDSSELGSDAIDTPASQSEKVEPITEKVTTQAAEKAEPIKEEVSTQPTDEDATENADGTESPYETNEPTVAAVAEPSTSKPATEATVSKSPVQPLPVTMGAVAYEVPSTNRAPNATDPLEEISLDEIPADTPIEHTLSQPEPHSQPPSQGQSAPQSQPSNTFIPHAVATAVPPKSPRKKRTHAPVNLDSLTDFMNDELSRSKASDVKLANTPSETPPPPPIRSAKH